MMLWFVQVESTPKLAIFEKFEFETVKLLQFCYWLANTLEPLDQ